MFSWPSSVGGGDRFVNYTRIIGVRPDVPEFPLWVEWRYASNNAVGNSVNDDAQLVVDFRGINDSIVMYGDAVISADESTLALNLELDQFRTFRFETISAEAYCFSIDGVPFFCAPNEQTKSGADYIQLFGHGGVDANQGPGHIINRWDFLRYGRAITGEVIVGADPPSGTLDAGQYNNLDRFTVTFDQPNYVYVDDITVEVLPNQYRDHKGAGLAAGNAPAVLATRRLDNGAPETVEIVLDQPLNVGVTTRFTFDTGPGAPGPQVVEYTLVESSPCCLSAGACDELAPQECAGQGGVQTSGACEGDMDSDGHDAVCGDACPSDAAKLAPGQCGCGLSEVDSDSDTVADCLDQCPAQDDTADANGNGTPDCLEIFEIPTTSTWGLVCLALMLTIIAKISYRRLLFQLF